MQDSIQILISAIAYLDLIIDRSLVNGQYFQSQLRETKEILETELSYRKIDTTKIDTSGFSCSNTPAPHLYEDDE